MHKILKKACTTIEKHNLLKNGDKVLVALSGGADSVCLLNILNDLKEIYGIKIYAAHLNHMLRGEDADGDEQFAKDLCKQLNIPFFSKKVNVINYAKENMQTTEEAGRNLRYEFFSEICMEHKIDKIATAHNQNDNVETVVMRFIRGTGLYGLAGIPYKNKNIIRPVLDLSRNEIEEYLSLSKSNFVTDKSNLEPVYSRNKVRLNLIPEIENEYNPHFKETLSGNIETFKNATDYLKKITKEKAEKLVCFKGTYAYIKLCDLKNEHTFIKSSIIHYILEMYSKEKQVTSERVKDIILLTETEKGSVDFSKELYVSVMYGKLYFIMRKDKNNFFYNVQIPSCTYIKECNLTVKIDFTENVVKSKKSLYVDYDEIDGKTVTIRNRKDGDFFYPSGMKGKKKLKDFFIDEKIPFFLRDEVPIVAIDNEIVCVGNYRVSEKYKVKSNTIKFLKIEISDGGV